MKLPLTKEEFEAILESVTKRFVLPLTDDMRVMAVSYFHSLDRCIHEFDEELLGGFLFKCQSNDLTYRIGQEIHHKRQAEAKAASDVKPELTVVDPQPNH